MIELPAPKTWRSPGVSPVSVYSADQLRTYGDQRAAEAREQMREECIKACQAAAGRGWSYYEEERRPVLRGKALGADVCVERIKELP